MPFGSLAPLPLRLGGAPTEGWTAAEQSRVAADLAAVSRSAPLAVVTVSKPTATTCTIESYHGRNGIGPNHAPTATAPDGAGTMVLEWEQVYNDANEVAQPWQIRQVTVCVHSLIAAFASVEQSVSSNTITINTWEVFAGALTDKTVTVVIYGAWGEKDRQIGDYDGATDKEDSLTEGYDTYAHLWLKELRNMRGSAYSSDSTSLVDAENLCIARQLSTISRAAEKLEANSLPGTSDEKLENWATLLDIPFRIDDQRWQVRQKCAAKLRAVPDSTAATVDDAVRELLGNSLVQIHRNYGTVLSSPPTLTYWPGANPGSTDYSLGGGAWLSERAHYWVEVEAPSSSELIDFNRLMNIDYYQLADLRLPAWATFAWATSDGFLLDISQMDFDSL